MKIGDMVRLKEDLRSFHAGLVPGTPGRVIALYPRGVGVFFAIAKPCALRVGTSQVELDGSPEAKHLGEQLRKTLEELLQPKAMGKGTYTPPPFGDEDLIAIAIRAEQIQDTAVKADMDRLMQEVKRLRGVLADLEDRAEDLRFE